MRKIKTGRVILLVEDCAPMRHMLAGSLTRSDFHVLSAESGEDALEVTREHPEIELLITDCQMPGMSGVELAQWFGEHRPGVARLIISSSQENLEAAKRELPNVPVLLKDEHGTRFRRVACLLLDHGAAF